MSPEEKRQLKAIFLKLSKLQSAVVGLQRGDIDLHQSRCLFDALINEGFELHHLNQDDAIVHSPDFEGGILKISRGKEEKLTANEERIMRPFIRRQDVNDEEEGAVEDNVDFASEVLNKSKKARKTPEISKYVDLSWIPATTNDVERLFSHCRRVFSMFRRAMTPQTLEILLYLKANRGYWTIKDVSHVVHGDYDDDDEDYNPDEEPESSEDELIEDAESLVDEDNE